MHVDQTTFRRALLDPELDRPQGLSDGWGTPAGRRFDVYRNNVAVSLTEALEAAFPVIRKLVGTGNFRILAGAFLRAHPPSSPLMMFYGDAMPGFLAEFGPTATTGYLPDVARLELGLRESYHAADADPIDPARLQALDTRQLLASHLTLAPAVRLICSDWPVFAIWRYNSVEGAAKPEMAAQDVLVTRAEFDPVPVLLPPGGGAFVKALLTGKVLSQALAEAPEDFDLTAALSILLTGAAIVKIGD